MRTPNIAKTPPEDVSPFPFRRSIGHDWLIDDALSPSMEVDSLRHFIHTTRHRASLRLPCRPSYVSVESGVLGVVVGWVVGARGVFLCKVSMNHDQPGLTLLIVPQI